MRVISNQLSVIGITINNKQKTIVKKLILIIILALGLFLRTYKLNFSLSAFAGLFAVWLLYLFIKNGLKKNTGRSENIALVGSLILAINPWHLYVSRGNIKLSLMLTIMLAMLVCLQYFFNKNNKVWFFSGLIVIISTIISLTLIGGISSQAFSTHSLLGSYLNHFSGRFLFIEGDWQNPGQGVIYHGLFYLIDAAFLFLGLCFTVRNGLRPLDRFMLIWLLLAPVPSVLSGDVISSVGSFTMVIPLVYFIANGIVSLLKLITNRHLLIAVYCLLITVYAFSFVRFADLYLIHNPLSR